MIWGYHDETETSICSTPSVMVAIDLWGTYWWYLLSLECYPQIMIWGIYMYFLVESLDSPLEVFGLLKGDYGAFCFILGPWELAWWSKGAGMEGTELAAPLVIWAGWTFHLFAICFWLNMGIYGIVHCLLDSPPEAVGTWNPIGDPNVHQWAWWNSAWGKTRWGTAVKPPFRWDTGRVKMFFVPMSKNRSLVQQTPAEG